LKEESFPLQGVLHTFSGTWKEAERFLDIGFYISFSGVLTYSKKAKEVALKTPFDRILIETDSPYLAPIPYKGQRNEPSYILRTVEELSRLKGSPIEKTAEITTENFISLFLKEQ
jgi:TatD DNase family protein